MTDRKGLQQNDFSLHVAKLLQRFYSTATQFPFLNNSTFIVDARPPFSIHFPNV